MGPCVPEPRRNIVAPLTAVAGVLERELLLLSVPKSRVMWRWSDLLRCPLSHAMSSGFGLRFVIFQTIPTPGSGSTSRCLGVRVDPESPFRHVTTHRGAIEARVDAGDEAPGDR